MNLIQQKEKRENPKFPPVEVSGTVLSVTEPRMAKSGKVAYANATVQVTLPVFADSVEEIESMFRNIDNEQSVKLLLNKSRNSVGIVGVKGAREVDSESASPSWQK